MTDEKDEPMKLVFAPGCFDGFEGTQEELDAMQAEIMELFTSGDFFANSTPVDMDALMEEDPELATMLMERLGDIDNEPSRKLH